MKITKRKDGRWRCRVPLGGGRYREIDGRKKSDVKRKSDELLAQIARGEVPPVYDGANLKEYIDRWIGSYTSNLAQRTLDGYESYLRTHILPGLGGFRLQEITRADVQDFVNSLELSPKTVHNIYQCLSRILGDAVKDGIIRVNPCKDVILPKKVREEIQPLTPDQARALLEYMHGKTNGDILSFILLTGTRVNEACGLCWDCIGKETITIKRQKIRNRQDFCPPKHGKARTIPLSRTVSEILSRHTENKDTGGPVFLNAHGRMVDSRKLLRYIKKYAQEAVGRNDVTVHSLRHSYASILLYSGVDLKTVQSLLGHSSPNLTFQIYSHSFPQGFTESAEAIDRLGQKWGNDPISTNKNGRSEKI